MVVVVFKSSSGLRVVVGAVDVAVIVFNNCTIKMGAHSLLQSSAGVDVFVVVSARLATLPRGSVLGYHAVMVHVRVMGV